MTFQNICNSHHVNKLGIYLIELYLIFHTFVPVASRSMIMEDSKLRWLNSTPAPNLIGSDARSMECKTSISYDDRTISSTKAWTGCGFNLSSFWVPNFSIAISTIGLHVLSMINKDINVLRGSPVSVPLTIITLFERSETHVTLNDEYLHKSSIKQSYISSTWKYCNVSKRNWWFMLSKASAKSMKTDVNLVLLWQKSSNAVFKENINSWWSLLIKKAPCQSRSCSKLLE